MPPARVSRVVANSQFLTSKATNYYRRNRIMKPESKIFSSTVGGKPITFETGTLAGQAGGAVTVRLGDTMIFAAATMSPDVRLGIDYFPLTLDYEERMYAGGRIPGSCLPPRGRH